MAAERATILCVEDDRQFADAVALMLEHAGYRVLLATESDAAEQIVMRENVETVLLDNRLDFSPKNGIALLRWLQDYRPEIPVVFLSGQSLYREVAEAVKSGAFLFLNKTDAPELLLAALARAVLQYRRRMQRLREQEVRLGITGRGASMSQLWKDIKRCGRHAMPTLIFGEPFTEKREVALAMHSMNSARRGQPFVEYLCEADAENVVLRDLFGSAQAASPRGDDESGKVGDAYQGTLFLDQIESMPLDVQGELAISLGGNEHVRFIAATSVELSALVSQRRFRKHLLEQFENNVVNVPSLRQRIAESADDFRLLTEGIIEQIAEENERKPVELDDEAWTALTQHDWPQNFRELRSVLRYLYGFRRRGIMASDVNTAIAAYRHQMNVADAASSEIRLFDHAERDFVTRYLQQVFRVCGKNWQQIESLSGLKRTQIEYLISKHGLRFV